MMKRGDICYKRILGFLSRAMMFRNGEKGWSFIEMKFLKMLNDILPIQ
ncbi:MAG: hypothetical protein HUJ74_02785 [Lachnospiraceae bacterium]|nr:hypothetical protein [Lachnospiraceae bacterium]